MTVPSTEHDAQPGGTEAGAALPGVIERALRDLREPEDDRDRDALYLVVHRILAVIADPANLDAVMEAAGMGGLFAQLDAMTRSLVGSGDMTPIGWRQIRNVLAARKADR